MPLGRWQGQSSPASVESSRLEPRKSRRGTDRLPDCRYEPDQFARRRRDPLKRPGCDYPLGAGPAGDERLDPLANSRFAGPRRDGHIVIDGIVVIGRWSKVELHREHRQTVLLAACSAALPVHLQAPTHYGRSHPHPRNPRPAT